MLYLEFGSVNDRINHQQIGPSAFYRVGGNFIRDDQGLIVSSYKNHCWFLADRAYTRYDTKQRVLVHFEDQQGGKSDAFGPYDGPWVADGSAYCEDKLFAKFMDTTLLWHNHESDTFWPWMVWSPAT
jgi:hypothetical protein